MILTVANKKGGRYVGPLIFHITTSRRKGKCFAFSTKQTSVSVATMSDCGGKAGIGAARIAWPVEIAPSPNQMLAETYLIALPLRAPFKP